MNTKLICLVLAAMAISTSALTCSSKSVGLGFLQIKDDTSGKVVTCAGTNQCISIIGVYDAKPVVYKGCYQDYVDNVEGYINRPELLKPNACNKNKLQVASHESTPVTLCSCSTANCNK
uniref:Secreted protein n=1 Tax=Rhabditophanes sp. KR3021 TaxID=114890 RepID=A0AC35TGG7_9BILA